MRSVFFITFIAIIMNNCACSSSSQITAGNKSEKEQQTEHSIETKQFTFNATNVNPMRVNILNIVPNGNQLRNLTAGYFLSVLQDSISVYLPYFGRAYTAPNPSSSDNGIKVNTKDFTYTYKKNKKDYFNIKIDLKNDKYTDYFMLDISPDGYATLQVQSVNREPISFYGTVSALQDENKK